MTRYIKSKTFSKSNHNQGLVILNLLIISSVFCLGFFYLIQTNSLVESNYRIRKQKEYLKELEIKNQELEVKITSWRSLSNLEKLVQSFL